MPATFVDLPQELIDAIITPLLPKQLHINATEEAYHGPGFVVKQTIVSVVIDEWEALRWAVRLRWLHSKLRGAVDVSLGEIEKGIVALVMNIGADEGEEETMAMKWHLALSTFKWRKMEANVSFAEGWFGCRWLEAEVTAGIILRGCGGGCWVLEGIVWQRDEMGNWDTGIICGLVESAVRGIMAEWTREGAPTTAMLCALQNGLLDLPQQGVPRRYNDQNMAAMAYEELQHEMDNSDD